MPLGKADAPANPMVVSPTAPLTAPAKSTRKSGRKTKAKAVTPPEESQPTEAIKQLAEKLPEKDEVQKAIKAGMLADDPKKEVAEKVKVVDASPNADETPSGYALKKVAGISDDTERGEEYTKHKTARRWGYVPADTDK